MNHMKALTILACCLLCCMALHAQNKEVAVNAAVDVLSRWQKTDIVAIEQELSRMTNVDTLRILAFASRSAFYPGNVEDLAVDSRLDRIFWGSVRRLCEMQTENAKRARKMILESGLVQDGDHLRFKLLEENGLKGHPKGEERGSGQRGAVNMNGDKHQ